MAACGAPIVYKILFYVPNPEIFRTDSVPIVKMSAFVHETDAVSKSILEKRGKVDIIYKIYLEVCLRAGKERCIAAAYKIVSPLGRQTPGTFFSDADHCHCICGDHSDGNPLADAAWGFPGRRILRSSSRAVHGYIGHLCDWPRAV